MRILFDQGTPLPLRTFLRHHQVQTVFALGWNELKNGDLLRAAEERFDLIVTTDKNWKYQQQLRHRRIAIVVLPTTNWPELKQRGSGIAAAVEQARPGDYLEL